MGEIAEAQKIADHLATKHPSHTLLNSYWLPTIRAAIELRKKNPARALELLRTATPYELFFFPPLDGNMYSAYLRGQAFLLLGKGKEAASEFQKFNDDPGIAGNYFWTALARIGLAHAYMIEGDKAAARAAYERFLSLWKDSDSDLTLLNQAKSEYAKLI